MEATQRHCAFCLIDLRSDTVKKCGKCQRRVYCSKSCQELDWSGKRDQLSTPSGQGHKNWCGMDYGEEDVTWKVVPIEGKGLGIVALCPIPPKYRIMVDACQTNSCHPGMKDLAPLGGTLMEKYIKNVFQQGDNQPDIMCIRMARVNHSCHPNASHLEVTIKDCKVKVLYSERDISPGEEIQICYTPQWSDHTRPEIDHRLRLKQEWNIVCPSDCICRNPEVIAAIRRARDVNSEFFKFCQFGKSRQALKALAQILELEKTIHIPFIRRKTALYDGFQMAIMTRATLGKSGQYVREVCEIFSSISHPKDDKMIEYKKDMESPHSNEHYLQEEP